MWCDIRTGRIPNRLLGLGLAAGLLMSLTPQGVGGVSAGLGLLTGLAAFLPFYALRLVGAGDVKLLAVVGIFMGYPAILAVALFSALAGGALAIGLAIWAGQLHSTVLHVHRTLQHLVIQARSGLPAPPLADVAQSTQMPYAVAIGVGTLAYAAWAAA